LNNQQIGRRAQAFIQASQFIKNAMLAGGTGPVSKSFNANDPHVPDARVDIAVYTGRALCRGPKPQALWDIEEQDELGFGSVFRGNMYVVAEGCSV
jgi:hypothetical protein